MWHVACEHMIYRIFINKLLIGALLSTPNLLILLEINQRYDWRNW
jgi:hypothetical protein